MVKYNIRSYLAELARYLKDEAETRIQTLEMSADYELQENLQFFQPLFKARNYESIN